MRNRILKASFSWGGENKIEISIYFNYLISGWLERSHQYWDSYIIYFFFVLTAVFAFWTVDASLTYLGCLQTSSGGIFVCLGKNRYRKISSFWPLFFSLATKKPINGEKKETFIHCDFSRRFFISLFPLKGTLHKSSSIKIDYDTFFFLFRINVET